MNLQLFERCEVLGTVFYRCGVLAGLPGVRHAFSTRLGRDHGAVVAAAGLLPDRLILLSQTHSDCFHVVNEQSAEAGTPLCGDALISTGPPVAVRVADCFPVLIADPKRRAVAAVHAGWRGTVSRLLGKTIRGMVESLGSHPADLVGAIGPGIRSCCFEVGPEVIEQFGRAFPGLPIRRPPRRGNRKPHIDLPAALFAQFAEAGVPQSNVFDIEACSTCGDDEFFSYRREGERAGRMIAVIGMVG